jgi:anthranilate phosphoribosyltransferase
MSEVLAGKCTDAQIAALLTALRMRGETVEEIVGFAEAIRAAAALLPIERVNAGDALDGQWHGPRRAGSKKFRAIHL